MIKRYYQSLNSLKFSIFLPGLTFLLFVVAYIREKKQQPQLTYLLYGLAFLLVIVMFFYYRGKVRISKQLKSVQNIEEYRKGGMVDKSWILKNRILAFHKGQIQEIEVAKIHLFEVEEGHHGQYTFVLNQSVRMSCQDLAEGRRFLAILLKQNPSIQHPNLEAEGSGLLSSLGGKDDDE